MAADRFLHEWRTLRPRLSAEEIMALGVPRGPELGEAIRLLRAARLDGMTQSTEDELRLLQSRQTADSLHRGEDGTTLRSSTMTGERQ